MYILYIYYILYTVYILYIYCIYAIYILYTVPILFNPLLPLSSSQSHKYINMTTM